ncbi:MAG TPA: anti-sigma factor [Xanthobacteraceae bacterium]|jgi:anti-sigma factor RsiW
MNCADSEVLMHALIDGELDAGHAHEIETHIAGCPVCAERLASFRAMRNAIGAAALKETAPPQLRNRIEELLTPPKPVANVVPLRRGFQPSRRSFFRGFAMGAGLSAVAAAGLVLAVIPTNQGQEISDDLLSAHLRSLQGNHLLDVVTSDQHTVKPWFNGRLEVAPPVIDLTAQGFTLLGGRLDYLAGEPVAAIVYQRRKHIINLFIARHSAAKPLAAASESMQGYNIRHWTENGLDLWAVSDLAGSELDEFVQKITAGLRPAGAS